jgi:hypothetical protein
MKKHNLNKEEGKMVTPIWQGTEGLWHDVEASKDQGQKMLTDQGQKLLTRLDGLTRLENERKQSHTETGTPNLLWKQNKN